MKHDDKPVIQKLSKFFAQRTPDDILQDGHVVCTPVRQVSRKKSDESVVPNEKKASRVQELIKSAVSFIETGDVQNTLKSVNLSKESSFSLSQEIHELVNRWPGFQEENETKDVFMLLEQALEN